MGCGGSAPAKGGGTRDASAPGAPAKKPLTFGKDPNLNVKDFTAAGVEDGVFVRVPGTVNGQSFQVNGCKRSSILILDHASQVTIDNCEDCRVVVAASSASVFVRNCTRWVLGAGEGGGGSQRIWVGDGVAVDGGGVCLAVTVSHAHSSEAGGGR